MKHLSILFFLFLPCVAFSQLTPSNIAESIKSPPFEALPFRIASVAINTYSSVEGDSIKNAILHQTRAKSIRKHIAQKADLPDSLFHITTSENWPLIIFQS